MTNQPSPVHVRSGSFEEALANGLDLLDKHPASALKQAETLIRIRRDARVYRLAAIACRKLGLATDAEGAELGAIEASLAEPELEQAAIAESEGRSQEARDLCASFLKRQPEDLLAVTLAADSAISMWDLEEAEAMLRTVIGRAPTFLRALMLLVKCLQRQSRPIEAIAIAEEVIQRKPNNLSALTYLTQLHSEVGDAPRAVEVSKQILVIDARDADRLIHHAHHLRVMGRGDDAQKSLRRALDISPFSGGAWWGLANYYPSAVQKADIQTMREGLGPAAGTPDEATLNLAIGLMAGHRKNYEESFNYLAAGKRLRLASFPFNPVAASASVDEALHNFNSDYFAKWEGLGSTNNSPVFVIGMHRSGSTLIERILAQHSKLEGAGELPILPRLMKTFQQSMDQSGGLKKKLASISPSAMEALGERYIRCSGDYRKSNKPQFIDKLNFNWMHLGFIRSALPNAKIIDVRRNAVDCCWANFKMLFTEGHPASNDLRHIGRFYRDYARFVDSIAAATPGAILKVRYEDVVDDIEGQTRRMLDFLRLEFEPACLDFHLSTDAVATASSEQVRQPLNRKGIGSAEPYRQWLGPLIEELGPLAD
jgi:tetratricopeptide (TPR) repeat protein